MNGRVETNTCVHKKVEKSKPNEKTNEIVEVEDDDDDPSKGQNQLGDGQPSANSRLEEADISTPRMEMIWWGKNS